jgi:transcriptional regulator with XRE-family HTH domain
VWAGLPPQTVVQYENGHRAPYATRLAAIARALGATPSDLTRSSETTTLAELRVNAGFTQLALAQRVQLVRTRYSAIERGEIATVDDAVIASLAAALGTTPRQVRLAHGHARARYLQSRP